MAKLARHIVAYALNMLSALTERPTKKAVRTRDRRNENVRGPRSPTPRAVSAPRRRTVAKSARPDGLIVRLSVAALVLVAGLIVFTPVRHMPDFFAEQTIRQASRLSTGVGAQPAQVRYRLTQWRELAPPALTSQAMLKGADVANLNDADPRAKVMLARMRLVWDAARPNPALDGVAILMAGYAVPIEQARDGTREFLLVPYYGACIHTPPPPANQIIDVTVDRPVRKLDAMDTVWVDGVLRVMRVDRDIGTSVYAMHADGIQPYAVASR